MRKIALILALMLAGTLAAAPRVGSAGKGRFRVDYSMTLDAQQQLLAHVTFIDAETHTTFRSVRAVTKAGTPAEVRLERVGRMLVATIVPKSDLSGTLRFRVLNDDKVEEEDTVAFPAP